VIGANESRVVKQLERGGQSLQEFAGRIYGILTDGPYPRGRRI
jgi:hypothetical protein